MLSENKNTIIQTNQINVYIENHYNLLNTERIHLVIEYYSIFEIYSNIISEEKQKL